MATVLYKYFLFLIAFLVLYSFSMLVAFIVHAIISFLQL